MPTFIPIILSSFHLAFEVTYFVVCMIYIFPRLRPFFLMSLIWIYPAVFYLNFSVYRDARHDLAHDHRDISCLPKVAHTAILTMTVIWTLSARVAFSSACVGFLFRADYLSDHLYNHLDNHVFFVRYVFVHARPLNRLHSTFYLIWTFLVVYHAVRPDPFAVAKCQTELHPRRMEHPLRCMNHSQAPFQTPHLLFRDRRQPSLSHPLLLRPRQVWRWRWKQAWILVDPML